MKLHLTMNSNCESTGGYDPEDEWSRDSTSCSWDFGRLSATEGYDSIEVGEGFEIGDKVFVVVAVWSTGDSFGNDEQACAEMMAVYKDVKDAVEAQKLLENPTEGKGRILGDGGSLFLPQGFEIRWIPWDGYFESLDYIEILERTIYP